jgi:hypothetical protein
LHESVKKVNDLLKRIAMEYHKTDLLVLAEESWQLDLR